MSVLIAGRDAAWFNERSRGCLPGLLGVEITEVAQGLVRAQLAIEPKHFAANGFLHAATVVTLVAGPNVASVVTAPVVGLTVTD